MPLLHIEGLTHYFGGLKAVSDFNLSLEEGEVVGLIGPNGAGKTTVFNLITGVYRPNRGRIRFGGKDLVGMASCDIVSMGIARTFQTIRLFKELSVLDNVRIGHFSQARYNVVHALFRARSFYREEERIRDKAYELLETFNLARYADSPAKALPYGEQRRLEIARALASNPEVLLLDEPAAGMNPHEIDRLLETIAWLKDRFGLTILLIEHQMRVVMGICERILVLDFGETIAEGTPGEIQTNPRVLEAYLGKEAS
ncbi:MAG: ABC transporter ATP-binding protein [Bacillota bacterium]